MPAPSNAAEKTVATFKGLDILENNAGVTPKPFAETTLDESQSEFRWYLQ